MADALRSIHSGILRTLQADPTVFSLTGGRIFIGEPPQLKDVALPAAAFRLAGGTVDPDLKEFRRANMQLWVFSSKSYQECSAVYDAIADALNDILVTRDGVHFVAEERQSAFFNFDPANEDFILTNMFIVRAIEPAT